MMAELELTELGPDGFTVERMTLPVGGMIEYHDQTGVLLATIKVTSIFNEGSSSNKQSVSTEERLPDSSEVSGEQASNLSGRGLRLPADL